MPNFDTLFQRHLREMTPSQRKTFILQVAKTGRFFDVPELWQIDDPAIILRAVNHFPEPLEPAMLEALERVLPQIQNAQESERAAAILYRYGKKSGEVFLKTRLKNNDLTAAAIFADNQDQSVFASILKLYSDNPQQSMILVPYLSQWHVPQVGAALLKAFEADQENAIYANALAEQVKELTREDRLIAIALINKQYNLAQPDEPAKIIAAASLIRMGADPQNRLFNFLAYTLQSKRTSDFNRYEVVQQLKYVPLERASPLLESIISSYIALSPSSLWKEQNDSKQVISPDVFAVNAAESLEALHMSSSTKDISILLQKLHDVTAPPELRVRTARALLNLGGSQAEVQKVMGSDWLLREVSERHLKSLPSNVFPTHAFAPPE